jgi:hypothetical protein
MSNVMIHWIDSATARSAAQQCLRDTGAAKQCPHCTERLLIAHDESAEERAYIRAEHLRKAGLRGFDGMSEREVSEAVRSALGGISDVCAYCG